jgi:hypothetical protein
MNPAEVATALFIERTLTGSPAFRKVDNHLFVVKQGSSYVMINVLPLDDQRALVRLVAQLVRGVHLDLELAQHLLELNARMRFGAFAYSQQEGSGLVLFVHSLLGGATLDAEELISAVRDVAVIADEYDDRIIAEHGGQTMHDLVEETAMTKLLAEDPKAFRPKRGEGKPEGKGDGHGHGHGHGGHAR